MTGGADNRCFGGQACLCDARTGQAIREVAGGSRNGDTAESIAFRPEKPWCVTADKSDQVARIWNIETAGLLTELKGHTGAVTCAEFSPDGRRVATRPYAAKVALSLAATDRTRNRQWNR